VFGTRNGKRCIYVLVAPVVAVATAVGAAATPSSPLTALVDAAAARLLTADPVAAFKWHAGTSIEDPERVDQVLATVTADAVANQIDSEYVTRIFTDQINATEAVEYGRFSDWKLAAGAAPLDAPDLSASREQIDALNHAMVVEITAHWELLHSAQCIAERRNAVNAVAATRQLDELYRRALDVATGSYCN
jgi:chorismate mutase